MWVCRLIYIALMPTATLVAPMPFYFGGIFFLGITSTLWTALGTFLFENRRLAFFQGDNYLRRSNRVFLFVLF